MEEVFQKHLELPDSPGHPKHGIYLKSYGVSE